MNAFELAPYLRASAGPSLVKIKIKDASAARDNPVNFNAALGTNIGAFRAEIMGSYYTSISDHFVVNGNKYDLETDSIVMGMANTFFSIEKDTTQYIAGAGAGVTNYKAKISSEATGYNRIRKNPSDFTWALYFGISTPINDYVMADLFAKYTQLNANDVKMSSYGFNIGLRFNIPRKKKANAQILKFLEETAYSQQQDITSEEEQALLQPEQSLQTTEKTADFEREN
ncbi:outer membrane protein [Elusimicrobium minutum]|uniref:outer membrane protein n=1 Tax=Elusimicrobium minutum TaxID=423605 RepID=UPI001EE528FA|nr:hypothetical protein [Elusimicrobium minutum]